jgi:hypothetical protein
MKVFNFHSDAGHGWVAVPLKLLADLKLIDKISGCSYIKGKTVYLEEDCDAEVFVSAWKAQGNQFLFNEKYSDRSAIRSYPSYNKQQAQYIIERNKQKADTDHD